MLVLGHFCSRRTFTGISSTKPTILSLSIVELQPHPTSYKLSYLHIIHQYNTENMTLSIGDTVTSIYGVGTVQEVRDGSAVIRLESWLLAGNQNPTAFLKEGQYEAATPVGTSVSSIYGQGVVSDVRKDGCHKITLQSWRLAGDQAPIAYLRVGQFAA